MKKKKLLELYVINEGPFDDINKQLGGAKSVARDPRAQQQQSQARDPSLSKTQSDLNRSKSIFDEDSTDEALGDGGTTAVNFTKSELRSLAVWADEYSFQPGGKELLKKIEAALGQAGPDSGGSSMSMSRTSTKAGY